MGEPHFLTDLAPGLLPEGEAREHREVAIAQLAEDLRHERGLLHGDGALLGRGAGGRQLGGGVEVGGLPAGAEARLFVPFSQDGVDRSGLGLGLSISRASVEANAGVLRVRDLPGHGCIFTIDMPRKAMPPAIRETSAESTA